MKLAHFLSSYDQSLVRDVFAGFPCRQLARIASDSPSRMFSPFVLLNDKEREKECRGAAKERRQFVVLIQGRK